MKLKKTLAILILFLSFCIIPIGTTPIDVQAHSGRTDSSGGHRDNKNKSGLGSYHYHCGGHPPHLHSDGVCPYAPKDTISIGDYQSEMYIGDNQLIEYSVSSDYSSHCTMSSSDEEVVSINGNELHALKQGTVTITLSSYNGSKQFTLTVKPIEVTDIELSETTVQIQVGNETEIKSTIVPENATNKDIVWTSNDDSIATVNDKGVITAKNVGTTEIVASTENGTTKTVEVETFVVEPESINSSNDIDIEITDNESIDIEIVPENSNNKDYSVSVKNTDIIKISEEQNVIKISPQDIGETEIIIKTWNGIEKSIQVKVFYRPIENITINNSDIPYLAGNYIDILSTKKFSIDCTIEPKNSTYKELKWSTSDDSIIKVSGNSFDVVGTGKVTLTCNSVKDPNVISSIDIVVMSSLGIFIVFILIVLLFIIVFIIVLVYLIKRRKR